MKVLSFTGILLDDGKKKGEERKMKYKVGYIGNFFKIIEYIWQNEAYELKTIICETEKLTNELITISMVRNLELKWISKKEELTALMNEAEVDFWIMCSFGKIIPASCLDSTRVYNIHYAMLPNYKGRHPTFWATLQGEKRIGISLHKVTREIDKGEIISQKDIPYYYWMDEISLFDALTEKVPILLEELILYLQGKKKAIDNVDGGYYKPVEQNDYTILLQTDSCEQIYNKVRAQVKYRGARLEYQGRTFWVKKIQFGIEETTKNLKDIIILPYRDNLFLLLLDYEEER